MLRFVYWTFEKNCSIKPFVAPEGAVSSLIHVLSSVKNCYLRQCWLRLKKKNLWTWNEKELLDLCTLLFLSAIKWGQQFHAILAATVWLNYWWSNCTVGKQELRYRTVASLHPHNSFWLRLGKYSVLASAAITHSDVIGKYYLKYKQKPGSSTSFLLEATKLCSCISMAWFPELSLRLLSLPGQPQADTWTQGSV